MGEPLTLTGIGRSRCLSARRPTTRQTKSALMQTPPLRCGVCRAALRAAGHRSARYTSPHLIDLSERFVIDGTPVSQQALVAAVADLQRTADALVKDGTLTAPPTFFEFTTATAFELFRRAGVSVAFGSDSPVTPIEPWEWVRAALWHHEPRARLSGRAAA